MEKGKNTKSDLFSKLPKPEREAAEANFERYVNLVIKIYNRMSDEEKKVMMLRLEWEKRNKGSNRRVAK